MGVKYRLKVSEKDADIFSNKIIEKMHKNGMSIPEQESLRIALLNGFVEFFTNDK